MAEMTSRERLMAAMRREKPDRVPIYIRGVGVTAPNWRENLRHPSYLPLYEAVEEKCDWKHGWGGGTGIFLSATDQVKSYSQTRPGKDEDFVIHERILETPKGTLKAASFSSTKGKPGMADEYYIKEREDAEKFLSIPYLPIKPDVSSFFTEDRRIGDRGIVPVSMGADPIYWIQQIMGSELLAIWSIEERELLTEMVEVMFQRCYDFVKYLVESGVGPVFESAGQELATPPLLSPKDFREFVVKYDKPLIDLVHEHDGLVHIHCHGNLDAVLEDFVEMGTDCLHPMEAPPWGDVPMAEAKRRIGCDICIEGNIQMGDIYTCTEEEMKQICIDALRDGAPDGGFILCPSASPFMPTLEEKHLKNYLTIINIGRKYGKYPLNLG